MRYPDLFIASVASHLPPAVNPDDAIAEGRYDPDEQARNEFTSVCVSEDETPPQMAARAGRLALERAAIPAADVSLLLHAANSFPGLDQWPDASYVHREVLGDSGPLAPALGVRQGCSGALGALDLAASYLTAAPSRRCALITAADRFHGMDFDRWRGSGPGIVLGDAASAAVLARRGFARLLSVSTAVDTELEGLFRGADPFTAEPGQPIDLRARRDAFLAGVREDFGRISDRVIAGLTTAFRKTLAEAEMKLDDISRFVFPNVGLHNLRSFFAGPLGVRIEATAWEWGKHVGHAGTADPFAGLAYLVENDKVSPGDLVMLISSGSGFTWICALLEMTARPDGTTGQARRIV